MKIYITHSSGFDYKNELYIPLRSSELNQKHEIALPHEHSTEQFNSKEYLKQCDLVIAEVSYPSTGQGIELGWADAMQVPIICIYKRDLRPSGALKSVSKTFIEYTDSQEMIKKISDYLSIK